MKTYFVVEILNHYKSRFDTYGEAVHQAADMAKILGTPAHIFKAISVVSVKDKTMTLTQHVDDLP
jgi:hypothetical protein